MASGSWELRATTVCRPVTQVRRRTGRCGQLGAGAARGVCHCEPGPPLGALVPEDLRAGGCPQALSMRVTVAALTASGDITSWRIMITETVIIRRGFRPDDQVKLRHDRVFPQDPCPARSFAWPSLPLPLLDREPAAPAAPEAAAGDLLALFGLVTDGRSGQGRDHPVAVVLALAAAAVVAGMKGYTAMAGWVKDG